MRYLILLLAILATAGRTFAQRDSTLLKEVSVYGLPITQYKFGSKVDKVPAGNQVQTLADALAQSASLYIKAYGNNQLSTIALRGTTASQTAVLWHGININSPTLGQTDLSLIPMFLFEEASLHYGTSSSFYGSDAIGGSIVLGQSAPQFKRQYSVSGIQQIGSFGKTATGVKVLVANSKWRINTKAYHTFIQNDFRYRSPRIGSEKRQTHAAVENKGLSQQVDYKISEHQTLSADLMLTDNFREIQPSVTNDDANETLEDKHLRGALSYQLDHKAMMFSLATAYIFSDQDYTDDLRSNVKSKQFSANASADHVINARSTLRYGLLLNHFTAASDNFKRVNDNRSDVYLSYFLRATNRMRLNANIRQSLYAQHYAPFAPTLGAEYLFLNNQITSFKITGQAGRGFRVPTLNDRFWIPGGNPNLKAEDSFQTEGSLLFDQHYQRSSFNTKATFYKSWVRDMIVWRQSGGLWAPENLQNVDITGVETSLNYVMDLGRAAIKSSIAYSFVESLNKTPENSTTDLKQLPYVPVHTICASSSFDYKKWNVVAKYRFTSARQTTLDNASYLELKSYGMFDVECSKEIVLAKWKFAAKAEVNNLMNIYYENLLNRAMPGRNFQITLVINIKS